jgi:Fur family ferric uptake transcriptional regulator
MPIESNMGKMAQCTAHSIDVLLPQKSKFVNKFFKSLLLNAILLQIYNLNINKFNFVYMKSAAIDILSRHQIRKTPFRINVLKIFLDSASKALNNADIEAALSDFDRITLYRTLKTFEKSGIIHQAIDGTNESKFALCHQDCTEHAHHDNHAHFLCTACGETICLENVIHPSFSLPKNYSLKKVHLALSGVCANCH